ncbi:MAG: biotin--[acetyl-CoA-carboxylase] ligase [Verrucomicrobiales bacterium]|nr:biotin--[acetyl-CoA-carboxylase] ligase [Verrucomicrobiales bacterium]
MTLHSPDPNLTPFQAKRLRRALSQRQADLALSDLHIHDHIASTNDEASRLAKQDAPNKTLVLAECQSAGRGRRGNVWSAPAQRDLLFSLILYPEEKNKGERNLRLPHLVGVAICQAIEDLLPTISAQLKWPNDVYVDGKKIAGILVESTTLAGRSSFIVGVGINVNSQSNERPPELRFSATSMRDQNLAPVDRHQVLAAFLAHFDQVHPQGLADFDPIHRELMQRSLLLNHNISAQLGEQNITGEAIGFAQNGELIIQLPPEQGGQQKILYNADLVRLLSTS